MSGGKALPTEAEIEAEFEAAYGLLRGYLIQFKRGMGDELGHALEVDTDALWNLSRSYADDIHRYKAYHGTEVPDEARRSAYLCKWIMKYRPLVVSNPMATEDKEIRTCALMTNELFAMLCASGIMQINWTDAISDKVRVILMYSLRHRLNSEDTYILFFAQICNL